MKAEISYDLVMEKDMSFVEGTYRLPNYAWQVFVFLPSSVEAAQTEEATWHSGVTGLVVRFPRGTRLSKAIAQQLLGDYLGVAEWVEVQGPDSIVIR